MVSTPLFFLHNPKAGGSAVRSALRVIAGGNEAPAFSNSPHSYHDDQTVIDTYAGYQFYSGHYGYNVFQRLRKTHNLVTNFRDPVQRIRSLYQYWHHNVSDAQLASINPKDAAIVGLAKTRTFSEFIRDEDNNLQLYIKNFHYRQLYFSGWLWNEDQDFNTSVVKNRISEMIWFYITETSEISERLLGNIFPGARDISLSRQNESLGETIDVCADDEYHIRAMNDLDLEIYAHALQVQAVRAQCLAT